MQCLDRPEWKVPVTNKGMALPYFILKYALVFDGFVMRPCSPGKLEKVVDGKINTWRGFLFFDAFAGNPDFSAENLDDFNHILFHVWRDMCTCDSASFRTFVYWLASIIQHPDRMTKKVVVFWSKQGAGKTVFWERFEKYIVGLHRHIKITPNPKELTGQFSYLDNYVFVILEEAAVTDMPTLRARTTSSSASVEHKFEAPVDKTLHCNFVVCLNENFELVQGSYLISSTNQSPFPLSVSCLFSTIFHPPHFHTRTKELSSSSNNNLHVLIPYFFNSFIISSS